MKIDLQTKFPDWYKAATLAERLALLRANGQLHPNRQHDHARGERRMQRWQAEKPFKAEADFWRRLEAEGVTEAELRWLLGETDQIDTHCVAEPPAWIQRLDQAFAQPPAERGWPGSSEPLDVQSAAHVVALVAPLINQSCRELYDQLEHMVELDPEPPFQRETVVQVCRATLTDQLVEMLTRTLVLELHVDRLEGKLEGTSSTERFQSFIRRLEDPERALVILREYPVLAQQVISCLETWVELSLEFLSRLCADWPTLRATFSPGCEPGHLVRLHVTGDKHRGGRAVMVATFSGGLRLVYKPRSLAIDVHLQELLAWLNSRGVAPALQITASMDCGRYGWVEYIAPQDCTSVDQIQRFYQRQGSYLALMYVLEATDAHFENIIAMGEHPVFIDLESLFHPHFVGQTSQDVAGNALDGSVLRVGMLPRRSWTNSDSPGVDTSGLGSVPGQKSPRQSQYWADLGTDHMHLGRRYMEMPSGVNRPRLNGEYVDPMGYRELLADGFARMYEILIAHRDDLLAADGPLARFAEDEVRVILRPTHLYSLILRESYHPDLLRDALERERFFDRLWGNVQLFPYVEQLVVSERADLWRRDIPLFTTHPTSTDVWAYPDTRIPAFFKLSGMSLVRQRVEQLSPEDLRRQLWYIRASFSTLSLGEVEEHMPRYHFAPAASPAEPQRFLRAACAVADHLETLALQNSDAIGWVGVAAIREMYWDLVSLGLDLYTGLPGVALFFAYLGKVADEQRYTSLARTTVRTILLQLEQNSSPLQSIGAFGDLGGLIYSLSHIGSLWQEPELLDYAERLAEQIPAQLAQEPLFDITSGAAGCIGSLLALHHARPSDRVLDIATQCGLYLLSKARPMPEGLGWNTPLADQPLTGFSHGVAGIAWALMELAVANGDPRFYETACAALAYERSCFEPTTGNWRDLRMSDDRSSYQVAWCHGAPGIGLARVAIYAHHPTENIYADLLAAIQTTLTQGFGGSHSLCHGDLGNLQLLIQARMYMSEHMAMQIDHIAAAVLEHIEEDGWLCGVPLGVETPGLMNGLAGIGYGLMRIAAPERVPLVLTLEAPR